MCMWPKCPLSTVPAPPRGVPGTLLWQLWLARPRRSQRGEDGPPGSYPLPWVLELAPPPKPPSISPLVTVQEVGFDWRLAGTAGERLVRYGEVRDTFAGVIFVGDSQIREVSLCIACGRR